MPRLGGADGCRGGWVLAQRSRANGPVEGRVVGSAEELLAEFEPEGLLAIDIPIGLPEKGARACDVEARKLLGWRRGASVFPAPPRSLLGSRSWEEASARRLALEGKRLSRQTFGILAKIEEVDRAIRRSPARDRVHEAHPELAFSRLAGAPLRHGKKRAEGRAERERLIVEQLGADQVERVRGEIQGQGAAYDDLLDAVALLITAERIADGRESRVPTTPERDVCGLPMQIVY